MRNVLITGGSRGIGAACVELFTQKGFACAFIYKESHDEARALARRTGALAVRADVAVRQEVLDAVRDVRAQIGAIDVLVNNAGISSFGLFADISQEEWERIFGVNVNGVFNCCQAVLPDMIRRKNGCIVNMSSMWGITGASCETAYSAAKAAVIGLTKALAKEVAPSGVRVNCVAPGVVDTSMNSGLDKDAVDALIGQTPLGILGSPLDIARAVHFFAADEASFITGQVLSPNGGFLI